MDRIDLFINVPAIKYEKLAHANFDENNRSAKIREIVERARAIQQQRFGKPITNSEMGIAQVKEFCKTDTDSEKLLKAAVDSGKLSARGYHRVLKVARTIADLEGVENIGIIHVSEALAYRPQGIFEG